MVLFWSSCSRLQQDQNSTSQRRQVADASLGITYITILGSSEDIRRSSQDVILSSGNILTSIYYTILYWTIPLPYCIDNNIRLNQYTKPRLQSLKYHAATTYVGIKNRLQMSFLILSELKRIKYYCYSFFYSQKELGFAKSWLIWNTNSNRKLIQIHNKAWSWLLIQVN